LTSITVDAANPNFASQGGMLYNKAMTTLIRAPIAGITGSFTVPNSVTTIDQGAFHGCTGLTSVTIGNSVTDISAQAFMGCTGLTSVTIPDSVTNIGSSAFRGCTGLTSVTIPDSVTNIGSFAFMDCAELTSVTVLRATPPTLEMGWNGTWITWTFLNTHADLQIFVPAGSVEAYKTAEHWSEHASRIFAIP
jgi:hypothetical protein